METFIRDRRRAPDRSIRNPPAPAARREPKNPAPSTRFAGRTIGFWLGGVVLGTGGCILGVCMPYHHPVAVVMSALWWGIFLGCLGASIGSVLGQWAE
jgi:hypothetical protein